MIKADALQRKDQKKQEQLDSLTEMYSKMRRQNYTPQPLEKLQTSKDSVIQSQQQQILQLRHEIERLGGKSDSTIILPSVLRICEFVKFKLRAHHIEQREFGEFLCPKQLVDPNGRIRRQTIIDVLAVDPF